MHRARAIRGFNKQAQKRSLAERDNAFGPAIAHPARDRVFMNLRISAVVLSCVLGAGCATAPGRSAAPAVTAVPANDQRYAGAWQQDAVESEATARSVDGGARRALAPVAQWQQALSAPDEEARAAGANQIGAWNAMPMAERLGNDEGQPLAIILDADETALDNSPYQARRIDVDGFHEPESWSACSTSPAPART
ncbi:MAG: hypothetical protein ACK558_02150 [Pseudomonadota bacterium]